jgi:hypothetical protein
MTNFAADEISAVLRLHVVLREAYSMGRIQIWYHSIDIHFIVSHVKFEYGLSVWKTG